MNKRIRIIFQLGWPNTATLAYAEGIWEGQVASIEIFAEAILKAGYIRIKEHIVFLHQIFDIQEVS